MCGSVPPCAPSSSPHHSQARNPQPLPEQCAKGRLPDIHSAIQEAHDWPFRSTGQPLFIYSMLYVHQLPFLSTQHNSLSSFALINIANEASVLGAVSGRVGFIDSSFVDVIFPSSVDSTEYRCISPIVWKSAYTVWVMNHADDKLNPKSLWCFVLQK